VSNTYPDSAAKVSLAYTVGRSTKTHLVEEYGIGEELAMNIFGWHNDKIACIAQMDITWPHNEEEDRIHRILETVMVMRNGWECDGYTIIAEGYVSTDTEYSRGKELSDAFVNDNQERVTECLSICHTDLDGNTDICALPYRIVLRNDIEWFPLLHTTDPSMLRNHNFLNILEKALCTSPAVQPVDTDSYRLALSTGLADHAGFYLQYDL
jgi:hypothetical protein